MSWQENIPYRSAILSVPDGDIPAYGYVEIVAGDKMVGVRAPPPAPAGRQVGARLLAMQIYGAALLAA